MAATDYDVIINGVKAKLVRGGDARPYTRRSVRQEIQQQVISQANEPKLSSRADQGKIYQTSWASGAQWWKPIVNEPTSYYRSNYMDVWSEPGKVVPMNEEKVVQEGAGSPWNQPNPFLGPDGTPMFVGFSNNNGAGLRDVYEWAPASNTFVDAGYSSGILETEIVFSSIYDPTDEKFYSLLGVGGSLTTLQVGQWDSTANNEAWLTSSETILAGARIFRHNGFLMVYNGESFFTIDKSGPTLTEVADDGMGFDIIGRDLGVGGSNVVNTYALKLAHPTPEGLYYVKNVNQAGEPIPYVFRIDRDAAGSWIVQPIATLPVGSVAMSVQPHMGSLIVACIADYSDLLASSDNMEANLYFVGDEGMGALGSPLGGRGEVDETPVNIVGAIGPHVFIAGQKRLWVYDAIRGGLHSALEWAADNFDYPVYALMRGQDSLGHGNLIFFRPDRIHVFKSSLVDDPETVVNFGDDKTTYTLESNYFDFNLPHEEKEITEVSIMREKDDGGSEWTVQIEADDGTFADALVDSGTAAYAEATGLSISGRRFRYKLIYQTKDTARKRLESLLITAATGQGVSEWDLLLDGDELLNVDNEVQDEEAFYDSMVTLSGNNSVVTFIDNMQEQGQETSDGATGTKVKIRGVEIIKDKPGESMVRLSLREA